MILIELIAISRKLKDYNLDIAFDKDGCNISKIIEIVGNKTNEKELKKFFESLNINKEEEKNTRSILSIKSRIKKNFFRISWENLNRIRLNLALIGNFDISTIDYEDALFCIETHKELKNK